MISRMTSLAKTPGIRRPETLIRRTFSGSIARHCDASTSRTCEVPIPNATAPNAPCVEVWLSPHAIVIPGWVSPSSGPITCTIPCEPLLKSNSGIRASLVFRSSAESMSSAITSPNGRRWSRVGTMWSTVPTVRSGYRTPRPRARSMSKAWGVVTS